MRWLAIAHHLPERTRLRTPVLRHDPEACTRIADALAAIRGVREVQVRPYTGSILVDHGAQVSIAILVDTTRRGLGIEQVLAAGEKPPPSATVPAFSSIARKLAALGRDLDRDLRRASDGVVDLGTLATIGFVTAGAVEIAVTGRLPLPPWFNLAWWGFRTFTTMEQDEIRAEAEEGTVSS